jgi:asparagine synthase (glutamine-hydrolysing)
MCGIAGIVNFRSQKAPDRPLLKRMTDAISHRGPDGEGVYFSGPVALGHRRLSIIDLHTGDQPMCNEDRTIWTVFNGEIYNFKELRTDLEAKGHIFRSQTDTEVIVHLYEEHGAECISRLRGMFAIALWDERNQCLLLARDRVGIKPLYIYEDADGIRFASEMKALVADGDLPREVNPEAIDRFLTYYYLPGNITLLKGIRKLLPGHYLVVLGQTITEKEYWDFSFERKLQGRDFETAVDELRHLVGKSVREHMISDVPVGVLLSGGVDSTGVLRYAAEHSNAPLNTFTVGFAGQSFADERPYARMASEQFGTIHHEVSVTSQDFLGFLPKYVWHMEEPVCEPPAISLYFLSMAARTHSVKVLLSGEGGDEAFAGYPKYRNLVWLEKLKKYLGPGRGLLPLALQAYEAASGRDVGHYKASARDSLSDSYFGLTSTPANPFNRLKQELYKADFANSLGGNSSHGPTKALFNRLNGEATLDKLLYVDSKSWLPDDLLIKADKMTMAASVELRVPLLDHQVLEFAASLPSNFKIHGRATKRILRTALENSVPKAILARKKMGFPLPYDAWLRNDLKGFVNDTLRAENASVATYFEKPALRKVLDTFAEKEGKRQQAMDYSREVFSLLVLELWHSEFYRSA